MLLLLAALAACARAWDVSMTSLADKLGDRITIKGIQQGSIQSKLPAVLNVWPFVNATSAGWAALNNSTSPTPWLDAVEKVRGRPLLARAAAPAILQVLFWAASFAAAATAPCDAALPSAEASKLASGLLSVGMQVGNHCEDFPSECGWSVGYGSNADESGDVRATRGLAACASTLGCASSLFAACAQLAGTAMLLSSAAPTACIGSCCATHTAVPQWGCGLYMMRRR